MRKPKKPRIPWSETPEGKEHALFQEMAKQGRLKVDETLCFVCQDAEKKPTHRATRGQEKFLLCAGCAEAVQRKNEQENRIKRALGRDRGGDIFRMVLGADLLPRRIQIEKLQEAERNGSR